MQNTSVFDSNTALGSPTPLNTDVMSNGAVMFDDGKAPPGWGLRAGFSVRITSPDEARNNAIIAAIYYDLAHPTYIWNPWMQTLSSDVLLELGRAHPMFEQAAQNKLGLLIHEIVSAVLIEEHARNYRVSLADICATSGEVMRDFIFVLRASAVNVMWDMDVCKKCGAKHRDVYPLVIMYPCAHLFCFSSRCVSDPPHLRACPVCARECAAICDRNCAQDLIIEGSSDVPKSCAHASIIPSEVRAFSLCAEGLPIPSEIVTACLDRLK